MLALFPVSSGIG